MKRLEIIYTEETKKLIEDNKHYHGSIYNELETVEFYVLDDDMLGQSRDISVAKIKVKVDYKDKTPLKKVLDIVEEMYKNEEYVVDYSKL